MSYDVPAFKVHVFASDFNFWIEINEFIMSTTNFHFTLIQNSKSLVKTRTLYAGTSGLIPRKNRLKFPTFHLPFAFLSEKKNTQTKWHRPAYFGIYYSWCKHQMCFKMVHFNIKTQNLEWVNIKCVIYAQPIPLSVKESIFKDHGKFHIMMLIICYLQKLYFIQLVVWEIWEGS